MGVYAMLTETIRIWVRGVVVSAHGVIGAKTSSRSTAYAVIWKSATRKLAAWKIAIALGTVHG